METTDGHLLDGRVRYAQPKAGFRSGIEPVLLAAAVPARPGEHVLEAGTGAGAGLLCLAARVPGLTGVGIERDPRLSAIAAANAVANGFSGLVFLTCAIDAIPPIGSFDHAFANPPYHSASGSPPLGLERRQAKHAEAGVFTDWACALAARLRHHGTLTLVAPAASLPACMQAFAEASCGSGTLLPLWPMLGRDAKLVLLQAKKSGRGGFRVRSGLTLHKEGGGYTPDAEDVLRRGQRLLV